MKSIKKFIFLLVVLLPVSVFSQVKTVSRDYASASIFFGSVKDNVYKNDFFGFKMDSPSQLYLLNQEQITTVREGGQKILQTENEKNNKLIEEAGQKEFTLYTAAEKPFGTEKNSSLSITVGKQPSLEITSEMVVTATKNLFLANPKIQIVQDTKNISLGGAKFSTLELQLNLVESPINQKVYITMRHGYAITFVLTYTNGNSLQLFEKLIKSLRFTKK